MCCALVDICLAHSVTRKSTFCVAGIALTERGNIDEPRQLFEMSYGLKPNPVAARCLGILSATQEAAWPYLQMAWNTLRTNYAKDVDAFDRLSMNLVSEMSFFLQQAGWCV